MMRYYDDVRLRVQREITQVRLNSSHVPLKGSQVSLAERRSGRDAKLEGDST